MVGFTLNSILCYAYLHIVSYLGNTQLEIKILPSHLIVTATGPAYFVADCGELLAWIGSALLSNTRNLRSYCLPLINRCQIDAAPLDLAHIKYTGHCNINFELAQLGASDELLLGIQTFSRDLLEANTLIIGFPIRRRPEGYPGLELSFDTLLRFLQTSKAELSSPFTVIEGSQNTAILVKYADDVFHWKVGHPKTGCPSCWAEHFVNFEDFGRLGLECGRHIISDCASDKALVEGMHDQLLKKSIFI